MTLTENRITDRHLAKRLADEFDCSPEEAYAQIHWLCEQIILELQQHHIVCLRGFGTFEMRKYKGRKSRSVATGQLITIPETHRVAFRAGSKLKRMMKGDI